MQVETNNLADVAGYAAIRELTTSRIYQMISAAEKERTGSVNGRIVRICETPYILLTPKEIKIRKQLKQK